MFFFVAAAFAASPAALDEYRAEHLYRSPFEVVTAGVRISSSYDPARAPLPWGVFDGRGQLLTADAFAQRTGDAGMLHRFDKADRKTKATNTAATVAAIVVASVGMSTGGAVDLQTPSRSPPDVEEVWRVIDTERQVADYYSDAVADERIYAYNASLRRRLGLTVEEAERIETTP